MRKKMPVLQHLNKGKIHAKLWLGDLESSAFDQVVNLTNLPFAFHHVAIMADAHCGKGTCIGSVLATKEAVVPNCVGLDVGCGMTAVRVLGSVPSRGEVERIMEDIRKKIPVGFDSRGSTHKRSKELDKYFASKIVNQFAGQASYKQIGTLGGGNHFIEIQRDELGQCYIMIHSGSRNLGKRVAEHFDNVAKEINRKLYSVVPPSWDLAFLPIDSDEASQYLEAVEYCCSYAELNRSVMLELAVESFCEIMDCCLPDAQPLDVRHNYVAKETHFGEEVFVHRKGAVRAYEGRLVIIPGSQGTKSFIAKGLGNPDSFLSCSHGAGRKLSRSAAKKSLDLEEQKAIMDSLGVVHGICSASDLDESPGAYKDISQVMENQNDLVAPLVTLTPIGVVKG
jgi:tRNA-splicing ligase RtcB